MKAQIEPFLKQWNLYRKVLRVDEVVRVDDKVDGCPMLEQRFIEVLDKYVAEFGAGKGGTGKGDVREKAVGGR
jgi:coenzyme F420-reducing hydrogenase gamma subunit